jgi:uncharacterized protein (TIGR03382 family)
MTLRTLSILTPLICLSMGPAVSWAGSTDADGDGYSAATGDCNDDDASVYPGAPELPDGLDNDCDGIADEGLNYETNCNNGMDDDGDSLVDCEDPDCAHESGCEDNDHDGYVRYVDCDDDSADVYPEADEVCDEIDNDCDSDVDEDPVDGDTWYADDDGDGFGGEESLVECEEPSGYVDNDADCEDTDPEIHPDAEEVCEDGIDNDCDGATDEDDEDCIETPVDADGDGYSEEEDCDDGDASASPGADEVCDDGIDNDCDDEIDEDCEGGGDTGTDSDEVGKDDGARGCSTGASGSPSMWVLVSLLMGISLRRRRS